MRCWNLIFGVFFGSQKCITSSSLAPCTTITRYYCRERKEAPTLRTGTVQRYSDLEGYGYIRPDDGGKELMVQSMHVVGVEALSEGQRVTYKVSSTKRGQAIASNVRVLDDRSSAS